ncbi:MAG: ParB/RepB/Spo0J family partition protein [Chloroflexi bacterium]|jgi:ParB family chromosome partitioning protein|nr:ParB/RepB/Spo0J family partition protein [Chloroflexota bacterium]
MECIHTKVANRTMLEPTQIIYLNPRDLLPSQPNMRSDPGDLAGLAETIREHGILQPLGVTPEEDTYRIVYGNRRRDAAIVVGLDRVPCVLVSPGSARETLVQQVLENLQRLDLNDLDKGRAFEQLLASLTEAGQSQTEALEAVSRTLGLSGRQIQRYLRLRQLPPDVQRYLASGDLGVTHGQHLVDLAPPSRQQEVADLAVEESLSAAELSRLCAALRHNANIDPAMALAMLRRGERVPTIEAVIHEPLHSVLGPAPSEHSDADDGAWPEDGEVAPDAPGGAAGGPPAAGAAPWEGESAFEHERYGALEPTTRDGHRRFKIGSLDAFMDELQRLTRCVQDGDLQRLIEDDPAAGVKLGLASRQLAFLSEAVSALARTGSQ